MKNLHRLPLLLFSLLISNISAFVIPGDQQSLDTDHSRSAVPPTLQSHEQPRPGDGLSTQALRPRAAPPTLAVDTEEAGDRWIIDNWWVVRVLQMLKSKTRFNVDYQESFNVSHPTKNYNVIVEAVVGEGFQSCHLNNTLDWAFFNVNKDTPSAYPNPQESAPWFGTPMYVLTAAARKGRTAGAEALMRITLSIEVDGHFIEPWDSPGASDTNQYPTASSGASAPKGTSPSQIASSGSITRGRPRFNLKPRTKKFLSNLRCPRKDKSQYSSFDNE